jgi:hypothetical protein
MEEHRRATAKERLESRTKHLLPTGQIRGWWNALTVLGLSVL